MESKDPLGLYRLLGLKEDADAAQIKAAYRLKAMDLHPDRNPGKDTTAEFQRLQQAYEILSDPDQRAAYDAQTAVPDGPATHSQSPVYEPIKCTRCGAISAQPRYRVFFSVFGYLMGATKTAHQGVMCSRCENIIALQASAKTMVFGWWSLPGFVWSIETLVRNLVGGQRYPEQDVKLQACQAMYFASVNNIPLARAVAQKAYQQSLSAMPGSSGMAKVRAKLGYATEDKLDGTRTFLKNFLDRFEGQPAAAELKDTAHIFNQRFLTQTALIAGVIAVLCSMYYRDQSAKARQEEARLQRDGMARAQAQAIATAQQEALLRMEQPLPSSGILARFGAHSTASPENLPPFKITASPNSNYLVKLTDWQTGLPAMAIFVRAGETVEVGVEPGVYRMKLGSGSHWYGQNVRFGPDTRYSVMEQPFNFSIEGNQLMGNAVRLAGATNGNLREQNISADEF